MSHDETRTSARAHAGPLTPCSGRPMRWRVRLLAALLRSFYFAEVRIVGAHHQPVPARGGRLIISSHRNGAIDGYMVLKAFPGVQGLISIQLLQHPLLRWMFDGIAVVRDKDRERHGVQRATFARPVDAGCAHLRAGGDLVIFPEGSSEWGFQPLPYQRGAARIVQTLLSEEVSVEVVPLGLHYRAPDQFRSAVEILVGEPVDLPPRLAGETSRDWERRLHQTMADALDAVSVKCPDAATFALAEAAAAASAATGRSYALAFVDAQQHPQPPLPSPQPPRPRPWDGLAVAAFLLLAAPVLLAGRVAGGKADARNTVSLFRITGGGVAALIWLPCLLLATAWCPTLLLPLWPLAVFGWWRWPRVMHRSWA